MSRIDGMNIAAAAIWHEGMTYSMPRPARHNDIARKLEELKLDKVAFHGEQGFITSTGIFVRRGPAMRIATEAGQLKSEPFNTHRLHSEDIW